MCEVSVYPCVWELKRECMWLCVCLCVSKSKWVNVRERKRGSVLCVRVCLSLSESEYMYEVRVSVCVGKEKERDSVCLCVVCVWRRRDWSRKDLMNKWTYIRFLSSQNRLKFFAPFHFYFRGFKPMLHGTLFFQASHYIVKCVLMYNSVMCLCISVSVSICNLNGFSSNNSLIMILWKYFWHCQIHLYDQIRKPGVNPIN